MSVSSLPIAKFRVSVDGEKRRDPQGQEQIAALTAALDASLARERASQQANAGLLLRQNTLALNSSTGS